MRFEFWQGKEIFPFSQMSRLALGLTQFLFNGHQGLFTQEQSRWDMVLTVTPIQCQV